MNIFFKFLTIKCIAIVIFITLSIVIFPLSMEAGAGSATEYSTESDDVSHQTYNVDVSNLLVPLVATDIYNNPVFDLEIDELELYVNGEKREIQHFLRITFSDSKIPLSTAPATAPPDSPETDTSGVTQKSDRLHQQTSLMDQEMAGVDALVRTKVILVDSLWHTAQWKRDSRLLAREIIANGTPEDRFLVLELRIGQLRHIAGPEPRSAELLAKLDRLKKNDNWGTGWNGPDDRPILRDLSVRKFSKKSYINYFKKLRLILQSIEGSKICFLITAGDVASIDKNFIEGLYESYAKMPEQGHGDEMPEQYYNVKLPELGLFDTMAKALKLRERVQTVKNLVHEGGSLLKTIDIREVRKENMQPIAEGMLGALAAYYELSFSGDLVETMKISVQCKRKDVRIDAVNFIRKAKPYKWFSKLRKKIFAINVALENGMNFGPETTEKIDFKKIETRKTQKGFRTVVEVDVPADMKNKKLEVFCLQFDDQFQNAEITIQKMKLHKKKRISLLHDEEKKPLFFVIVEPAKGVCVYNEITKKEEKRSGPG